MCNLKGQTSIVTRGYNGIGKSIAVGLSLVVTAVVISDIDRKNGLKKCKEIPSIEDIQSTFVHTDMTKSTVVENLIKETIIQFGPVDILVNNAGILSDKIITHITEDE